MALFILICALGDTGLLNWINKLISVCLLFLGRDEHIRDCIFTLQLD